MRAAIALGVLICLASRAHAPLEEPRVFRPGGQVELRGKKLTVHLAAGSRGRPLLLYITGDGGFPGDEKLFERMAPWGYPMAAIDAIDYVATINTGDRSLTPTAVAADIQAVIGSAQRGLGLPADRPTVLVGFSRGAGLSVAAATQRTPHSSIRGMLLLALGPDEVFVAEEIPALPANASRPLKTYEALSRLGSLRVALIQSTRDDILPAAEAQRRFGPEGPRRRFRALDAKDHSFGGSLTELTQAVKAGIDWIVTDSK